MCAYKSCPMFSAPCLFSDKDINESLFKTTICPIGEDEYIRELDPENTFFCLVVGSRSFSDYSLFSEKLRKMLEKYRHEPWEIIIISGGADGADSLAEKFAEEHKYHMVVIKADWDMNGKRAGYIRNEEMHRFISEFPHRGVMAFWDGKSRGTQHSFELAKKYHNQIRICRVSGDG